MVQQVQPVGKAKLDLSQEHTAAFKRRRQEDGLPRFPCVTCNPLGPGRKSMSYFLGLIQYTFHLLPQEYPPTMAGWAKEPLDWNPSC